MHIFFSVGEPSGDNHAAHLIKTLRRRDPNIRISGLGGPRMEQAGCSLQYPLTNLAVMGFIRVLPLIWTFYKIVRQTDAYFARHQPDLVVLVDFPGFNWWIARRAKARGIPVVYYLPPQLWAWAPWRIRRVHKYVDLVLSGLKFETEWYAARGVPVLYVGHPFFDEIHEHPLDQAFCREWKSTGDPVVAVLPGSRGQEVTRNWPIQLEAIRRLHQQFPNVSFLVANYKETQREFCRSTLQPGDETLPISFFVGKTSEIISLGHCAMLVSGSVSLELVARGTPGVVMYRCSWLTNFIGRRLVTCKYMTLANLMRDRMIFPEYLSVGDPEPTILQLVEHVRCWLQSPVDLAHTRRELESLRAEIGEPGATERVAGILVSRLSGQSAEEPAQSQAA